MPFGMKPRNDGSGRTCDFDKVFRLFQRAVRQAGLEPVRANQHQNSIIHADMFRALRESPIVLADLSLNNPNVFYEVGIRHALCPSGTVLVCQAGTDLPFDVRACRVVYYHYDGAAFDFEEADRLTDELVAALEEAKREAVDSPVHVMRSHPDFPSDGRTRSRRK
jgi:hypothetical protein